MTGMIQAAQRVLRAWDALAEDVLTAEIENEEPTACELMESIAALRRAVPGELLDSAQPAQVQFQRRRGMRDGAGGFRWFAWEVCSEHDAKRIAGLQSWQWRKVVATADGSGESS